MAGVVVGATLNYNFSRTDRPNAEAFNLRWNDINRRFATLESFMPSWETIVADFTESGLTRLDEVVVPIVRRLQLMAAAGFLVASSSSNVSLTIGDTPVWVVPPGNARDLFTPSPFTIVQKADNPAIYAIVQTVRYVAETGEYYGKVVSNSGDAAYYATWSIGALAGSTLAQMQLLALGLAYRDAAQSARDLAQKWATQTGSEVVAGQGFGAAKYAADAKTSQTAVAGAETRIKTSETNAKGSEDRAKASADLAAQFDPTTYQRTQFPINLFSAGDGNLVDGQTTFTIPSGYTVGSVQVYLNGTALVPAREFTASNGSTVVLQEGVDALDTVVITSFLVNGVLDVAALHHTHLIEDLPATVVTDTKMNAALLAALTPVNAALVAATDAITRLSKRPVGGGSGSPGGPLLMI